MSNTRRDREGFILDDGSDVDMLDPVNWSHPANDGLSLWSIALPATADGRTYYDLAGNRLDGTLNNMGSGSGWGPTIRPGGFGQITLDGVDDYIDFGSSSRLDPGTGSITVLIWVRATLGGSARYLVTKGNYGPARGFSLILDAPSGNLCVRCNGSGDASQVASQNYATPLGDWHQFGCVIDRTTNTIRGYLDGSNSGWVDGGGGGTSSDLTGFGTLSSTNSLYVGCAGNPSPLAYADGRVDNIRIWNGRALSAAEIQAEYDLSRRGYPGALNRR